VLCALAQACLPQEHLATAAFCPLLRQDHAESHSLMAALATLQTRGFSLDHHAFFGSVSAPIVPLPTYPFQRQRYWLGSPKREAQAMIPLERNAAASPPSEAQDAPPTLLERLGGVPAPERENALLELIRTEISRILDLGSSQEIDRERPLNELGLDSLAAVELRNRLNTLSGLQLSATLLYDCPTPLALAQKLNTELFPAESTPPQDDPLTEDIARIDLAVSALAPDDPQRIITIRQLQSLLSKWTKSPHSTAAAEEDYLAIEEEDRLLDLLEAELNRPRRPQ
jgi:acyl transferase domain-containing protein